MKKMKFVKLMAAALASTLILGACGAPAKDPAPATQAAGQTTAAGDTTAATAETAKPAGDFKVGVVLTTSGKGDKSYNDSALAGLERFKAETGINYKEIQPKDVADFEKSIEFLAKEKYNLVFCIGFTAASALETVAPKYPDTQFAIIDYNYGDNILPNVKSIVFKEEEGSYLAGVLAGSTTKTGVVGYVGGMESPIIQKFEVGFKAGVLSVKPDAEVLITYVSADASGFNNPSRAKEIALNMTSKSADIIYQAAGGSGVGVLEAAEEKGILAIGVDSNQNWIKPGFVLASMLKRVDNSVYNVAKEAMEGKLVTGETEINDLAKDGVGLTDLNTLMAEETNDISAEDQAKIQAVKDAVPAEAKKAVEDAKAKIIKGEIVVPSTR